MKKTKTIKAWAVLNEGSIPENDDSPRFMCIFASKQKANSGKMFDEKVIPVLITFPVPSSGKKKKIKK